MDKNKTLANDQRKRVEGVVAEILKKIIHTGVNAFFFTEENVRNIVSDLKLPKDVVSNLVHAAKGSKDELYHKLNSELNAIISKVNLKEEIKDILSTMTVQVKSEIRFKRKKDKYRKE